MERSRRTRRLLGRMRRTLLPLILVICLLASATLQGCTTKKESSGEVETKVITDFTGRRVTIPADPQRVACLYASTAHMLALVGEERKIVGAPGGVKRDILMQKKYPGITDISVPFEDSTINIEELAKIDADLALVRKSTADSPGEVEKLNKLGIPYVVVDYFTIDDVKKAIGIIGEVFDKEQKVNDYLAFFDQTLDLVKTHLGTVPESERVSVYHSVNEATRTDRSGDICSQIIGLAQLDDVSVGGNVRFDAEKSYTTLEQIYKWDPDCVIANDPNVVPYMLSDSKWQGLRAVVDGRVYPLPCGVSRWCHPGSMEPHMAVLFLAKQFYPDAFKDVNIRTYTHDSYKKYFDLDLSDEEVTRVLQGRGMRLPRPQGDDAAR